MEALNDRASTLALLAVDQGLRDGELAPGARTIGAGIFGDGSRRAVD